MIFAFGASSRAVSVTSTALASSSIATTIEASSGTQGFQPDYNTWRDSTVLRNIGVALGHSLLAYASCLRGLAKQSSGLSNEIELAARELGMRTMVASDIREHFGDAIRQLDPEGEQP